jgi:hypothetical protein
VLPVPGKGKRLETVMAYLICSILIGAGATMVMDLWEIARRRLTGIPPPD